MVSSHQCRATVSNGSRQCKRKTKARYPYCYSHTDSKLGVQVKKSTLPNAGQGLFATEEIKANKRIIEYTGKRRKTEPQNTDYTFAVKNRGGAVRYIDSADPSRSSVARYVNACRSGQRCQNNAVFRTQHVNGKGKIILRSKKKIKKNREIFASYGKDYWKHKRSSS